MKRRDFLKIGAGLVGFPYFVSSSALGKAGAVAPSNRLVMGAIGVGSMGRGDLNGFLNKDEVVQFSRLGKPCLRCWSRHELSSSMPPGIPGFPLRLHFSWPLLPIALHWLFSMRR